MNYQALFIDLDDTLLDAEHAISAANAEALRSLKERGIQVVLCSGRPTISMKNYMRDLFGEPGAVTDTYFISFNGALIYRWDTDSEIHRLGLPVEPARELALLARQYGITAQAYRGDGFFVEQKSREALYYHQVTGMDFEVVEDLPQAIIEETPKLLFHAPPEKIESVIPRVEEICGGRFHYALSKPIYLEFLHPEVNKAAGMRFLLDRLKIDPAASIAVGDSMNDVEMIREAGLGIAVGNAREELKAEADVVLGHRHDEDALAFVAANWF